MNIRVSVKYCGRSLTAQINPKTTLNELIQHTIDGAYAKKQMLLNPGVYLSDRGMLCKGDELNKALEVYFPMISLQGPPVELLILREEEFIEYDIAIKSQPKLVDSEPPDLGDSQPIQKQPDVSDLFPQSNLMISQQGAMNQGQFTLKFKTTANLSKQGFEFKNLSDNNTINDIKDQLFKYFGFQDRSIVDLDLYYNDIPLQGVKCNRTLAQLSIPPGETIEIKARWTGGSLA
ncbi:unnamed protein product (macronuclear) [Paramecium tetraurelia]|uniref:Ubiquitin-like domain-containing protein n=1 Tax=Paramecium tetraurelia TaxID=5888 RepID=A0BSE2_PARTE|nr:uncharacterized protein GSPATT00031690001 [Paramecium tetraurelia]CAK61459.1 unnamed protein product [Paramecium tetraurelia]|eukprot:XP_001428857.1 hypothetical protein (macronuclear) [Paramecium tetraurelia strain d4-2]